MVRPVRKSRARSTKSISGRPAETSCHARSVGSSRPAIQPPGTAIRGRSKFPVGTLSPDIIEYVLAVMATSGAIGPSVSSDQLSGMTPVVSLLPSAGLNPVTPQRQGGLRIYPPVLLPISHSHMQAAPASPDPPDDPPATRLG